MAWQQTLHRQNSLTASNNSSQPKICPSNNTIYHSQYNPEQRLSLTSENIDAKTINNLAEKVIEQNCPLPKVDEVNNGANGSLSGSTEEKKEKSALARLFSCLEPKGWLKEREELTLYMFASDNRYVYLKTLHRPRDVISFISIPLKSVNEH